MLQDLVNETEVAQRYVLGDLEKECTQCKKNEANVMKHKPKTKGRNIVCLLCERTTLQRTTHIKEG
jgi:hypothetical protein